MAVIFFGTSLTIGFMRHGASFSPYAEITSEHAYAFGASPMALRPLSCVLIGGGPVRLDRMMTSPRHRLVTLSETGTLVTMYLENEVQGPLDRMIGAVEIQNFRCFEKLEVTHLKRINVIVGDNGSGKTAFLEAMFLAMGESSELANRYRQLRGIDGNMTGDRATIEKTFVGDMFYNQDMSREIRIRLISGDDDKRQVYIGKQKAKTPQSPSSMPVVFRWTNNKGNSHEIPLIGGLVNGQVQFLGTGEEINRYWYMAANASISQSDMAGKFSELIKANKDRAFIEVFAKEFTNIIDMRILVEAGLPILYATLRGSGLQIPVANTSGAIGRILYVLLSLNRERNIVLIDEIDNGVYHARYESICRTIIRFAIEFKTQVFMSTHNDEWLKAFVRAAKDNLEDVSLIRIERLAKGHSASHFDGDDLAAGMEMGAEVR